MSASIVFDHTQAVAIGVKAAVEKALKQSADRIAAAASAACPVDSGDLQASIKADATPREEGGKTVIEISAGRGLPDARAVYAEYGTGGRGQASQFPEKPSGIPYQSGWPGMRAEPYMTPAAVAEKPKLPAGATLDVRAAISEACQ